MYKRWLNITTIYCELSIYKIKQNHSEIDLLIFFSEYNRKCYKQSISFGLVFCVSASLSIYKILLKQIGQLYT